MRGRRRRRFKGTWLPTLGSELGGDVYSAGLDFSITPPSSGRPAVVIAPLTFDVPQEPADLSSLDHGLSEFVGNEYALRRIVGKFHAAVNSAFVGPDPSEFPAAYLVTCGFFVARASDIQDNVDTPIGGTATFIRDYSPDQQNTIREPWIWRRSWVLADKAIAVVNEKAGTTAAGSPWALASAYPGSTGAYGSVADGPHIDAKTRRRVGNDDRLFVAVDAKIYPPADDVFATPQTVRVHLDYRLFGALRKARNRGAF